MRDMGAAANAVAVCCILLNVTGVTAMFVELWPGLDAVQRRRRAVVQPAPPLPFVGAGAAAVGRGQHAAPAYRPLEAESDTP